MNEYKTAATNVSRNSGQMGARLAQRDGAQRISVTMRELDGITPQAMQPRAIVPPALDTVFLSSRSSQDWQPLFDQWHQLAEEGHGAPINARGVIEQFDVEEPQERKSANPNVVESYMEFLQLAASIKLLGLQSPISIAPDPQGGPLMLIEFGHRRWLAFQFLNLMFPFQGTPNTVNYGLIPVVQQQEFNATRTAHENQTHKGLSPIELARQYAISMIAICQELGLSHDLLPADAFKHSREYFAQVADMSIPRGKGAAIRTAVGVSTAQDISRIRALLSLTNEDWDTALTEGWSLNACLKQVKAYSQKPKKKARKVSPEIEKAMVVLSTLLKPEDRRTLALHILGKLDDEAES